MLTRPDLDRMRNMPLARLIQWMLRTRDEAGFWIAAGTLTMRIEHSHPAIAKQLIFAGLSNPADPAAAKSALRVLEREDQDERAVDAETERRWNEEER
jgi:hypothetical protein